MGITNGTEAAVLGAKLGVWPMPNETKIYVIPERFTFDEDTSLKVFLRESTDCSIEIVAQNLRKTDSLLMQFLIAAARKWRGAGLDFGVSQVPAEIAAAMQLLGVGQEELKWQVAA